MVKRWAERNKSDINGLGSRSWPQLGLRLRYRKSCKCSKDAYFRLVSFQKKTGELSLVFYSNVLKVIGTTWWRHAAPKHPKSNASNIV